MLQIFVTLSAGLAEKARPLSVGCWLLPAFCSCGLVGACQLWIPASPGAHGIRREGSGSHRVPGPAWARVLGFVPKPSYLFAFLDLRRPRNLESKG